MVSQTFGTMPSGRVLIYPCYPDEIPYTRPLAFVNLGDIDPVEVLKCAMERLQAVGLLEDSGTELTIVSWHNPMFRLEAINSARLVLHWVR